MVRFLGEQRQMTIPRNIEMVLIQGDYTHGHIKGNLNKCIIELVSDPLVELRKTLISMLP